MKRTLMIMLLTLNTQAFAMDICQTSTHVSKVSIAVSELGQHAIIFQNHCSLMADGQERCNGMEASYFIKSTAETRKGTEYELVKEDGIGLENLTLTKSLHLPTPQPGCPPRSRCYETDIKEKFTVEIDNKAYFTCIN